MSDTMTWANKRDRGGGGVASRFHVGGACPAAPHHERSERPRKP